EEGALAHNRDDATAWEEEIVGVAKVVDVLSALKGRVHHDPVISRQVREEVAKLDVVSFGGKHVRESAIEFKGVKSGLWVVIANRVQDVPLTAGGFEHAVALLDRRVLKHLVDHGPGSGEESRKLSPNQL